MSSSTVEVAPPEAPGPKPRKARVGRTRKLAKRVEPKPDGRYLIYYEPS